MCCSPPATSKTSLPRSPGLATPRFFYGGGFTLIELLVVISIIALLIGILLPVLGSARETARGSASLSNVRQINLASQAYLADNKEFLLPFSNSFYWEPYQNNLNSASPVPASEKYVWPTRLIEDSYLPGALVFQCPSLEATKDIVVEARTAADTTNWKLDPDWYKVHYGMNFTYMGSRLEAPQYSSDTTPGSTLANRTPRMSDILSPSETIYFADTKNLAVETGSATFGNTNGYVGGETAGIAYLFPGAETNPSSSYGHADARHNNAISVAYADGHGSTVGVDDPTQIWGPEELTDYRDDPNDWDRE